MMVKNALTVVIFWCTIIFGFGQQNSLYFLQRGRESVINLSDSTVKMELASFTLAGRIMSQSIKIKLTEIPFTKCSESSAHFRKGNWYSNEIMVDIYSDSALTGTRIKNINYIHQKYILSLPEEAFLDIYDPKFCQEFSEKNKSLWEGHCKVYRSVDKRRAYIYMLNGEGSDRYEVTWVIQNSEYLTRVIDFVPDRNQN